MAQETLLSQSTIWLFGRVMADIRIDITPYQYPPDDDNTADLQSTPRREGENNFLQNQLKSNRARFARIYSFSYEGHFYDMATPAIFLVHGKGIDPDGPARTLGVLGDLSRTPGDPGRTVLGTQAGSFASNLRAWAYDRADFTVRLDIETGSFDRVLLESELGAVDPSAQSAGSLARSAGSLARSAGSLVRSAGSLARGSRSRTGSSGTE
jgi:hypothetical protein